jgi:acetyl esterase/lipase
MRREQIILWTDQEYHYPMAQGFVPHITTYLHNETQKEWERPCIIVVPGGAYCFISPSEGEIVAKKFYDMGFNAFVLTYTVNVIQSDPLKMQPLHDISRALRYVRAHSVQFGIDPHKVVVCGFSAGGHLCGSLCVHYKDVQDDKPDYQDISNRPDAAILCYPVITSGEKAHKGSFDALLGMEATEEELTYFSLEKQVHDDTPPCFLWQTITDETVPVENSYFFAKALLDNGIPFAHHVFSEGGHGLSTADEAWARGEFGDLFTLDQTFRVTDAVKSGKVKISEETRRMMEFYEQRGFVEGIANLEVSAWPDMVKCWLQKQLHREGISE